METIAAFAVGAALLAGLAGSVLRRLPGVPLSWAATVVWASIDDAMSDDESMAAWIAVAVATVLAIANYLVQHRLAGGDWSELAIPGRSWLIGVGAAGLGMLIARVPGMIFGFVGGTYIAERVRLDAQGVSRNAAARSGTARTVVLSRATLAELVTAAAIGSAWLLALAG